MMLMLKKNYYHKKIYFKTFEFEKEKKIKLMIKMFIIYVIIYSPLM